MPAEKCSHCGTEFSCGRDEPRCWCAELPALEPVEGRGCLCRDCLSKEIEANKGGGGIGMAIGRLFFGTKERLRKLTRETLRMDNKTAEKGKIYGFQVNGNDGNAQGLSRYKGKVLLIVNTASECGFTRQYAPMQELYEKYREQGLRVLAFPSNDFGAQEPGTDAEIRSFCSTRYKVGFDLFAKIAVKGPQAHPLYRFLTTESGHNGPIPWNFSKFLVARDGRVTARFGPDTDPLSPALTREVEALIAER